MISILTLDGERLARWGDSPVNRSCHGIWCDSHNDLYVVQPGEWGRVRRVVKSPGNRRAPGRQDSFGACRLLATATLA